VLGIECLDVALLEVGVRLNLVDGGDDHHNVEEAGELLDGNVADADGADLPSASNFSSARWDPRVLSKMVAIGLCRMSRSISSMPSFPALLLKACSVSS